MDAEIKRWTSKRKPALVMDIIQGKTTVAEASLASDLTPSEIESWISVACFAGTSHGPLHRPFPACN